MKAFMRKLIVKCVTSLVSVAMLIGCAPSNTDDAASNSASTTEGDLPSGSSISFSGVIAQGYVRDAKLFADYDGDGLQDSNEPVVTSGSTGSYSLSAISGDWNLVSTGGIDTTTGKDALPLKAPAPAQSGETSNVTPLTSLVAASPAMKDKLEELGGWNADIASSAGASGKLLRIAHMVEQSLKVVAQGDNPLLSSTNAQLIVIDKLAEQLSTKSVEEMSSDDVLQEASSAGLVAALSDEKVLNTLSSADQDALGKIKGEVAAAAKEAVQKMTVEIANSDTKVTESSFKDKLEEAVSDVSAVISDAKNLANTPLVATFCGTADNSTCDDNTSSSVGDVPFARYPKFGYVVFAE